MKNLIAVGLLSAMVFGVVGFITGRYFPVHHWVPYKGYYLYDSGTGKVCYAGTNPFKAIANGSDDPLAGSLQCAP
jgi:hypothetical protein